MNAPPHVRPEPPPRFSEELAGLAAQLTERSVTLREILGRLHHRAYLMFVMLLCLPFVAPVSVPGMSTPFGAVIALIALSLMAGRAPWLPARLLDRPLPAGFFGRVIALARGLVRWLEKAMRLRLPGLFRPPALPRLHAAVMFLGACLLALPLPIPLTNTFPAWAIFLTAAGLLERDGVCVLAGYAMLLVSFAYFAFLGESAEWSVEWLEQQLGR